MARARWREVLVAVIGLTPQVITETLYGLTQLLKPRIVPNEIHVMTTENGREQILKSLLDTKTGQYFAFCREFGIEPESMGFSEASVHLLRDGRGRPLPDIRDKRDNMLCADQVSALVQRLADGDDTRLHGSIAGGRKTMGIYLAAAFSLFGRAQDRLYHVFVNEPFENHPRFFFKPRKPVRLPGTNVGGRRISSQNTRDAVIELAEVPFLRLRGIVEPEVGLLKGKYQEMLKRSQEALDRVPLRPPLVVQPRKLTLTVGEARLSLSPLQMAIYTYFARVKAERCVEPDRETCGPCRACFQTLSEMEEARGHREIGELVDQLRPIRGATEKTPGERWREGVDIENFHSYRSRINGSLQRQMPEPIDARDYYITPERRYGETRYGLAADKTQIRIEG